MMDGRDGDKVARLTKTAVEGVPQPGVGGRAVLWDAEVKGFGVRVTSSGARTYVLRYRMGGRDSQRRTLTIGRHGSPWTAEQARRRAIELLAQVRSGSDPAAARETERIADAAAAEARADRAFDVLADRWFAQHVVGGGLRSEADIAGVLRRDLKPAFAGMTVDQIVKEKAADALRAIGGRSPDAANKAFKWGRQLFNWLVGEGVCDRSPFDKMKRPYPEAKRKRVLTLAELVVLWVALDALPAPFSALYRLLILLGQRIREVAGLPWTELDLEAGDWLIPGSRTKNKLDHLVPLPEQAIDLIEALQPEIIKRRGPAITTNGLVGVSGFSKLKIQIDEAIATLVAANGTAAALVGEGVADWVAHDLRRSLATGCQGMGVPMPVTEAILNHVSGSRAGIAGVYQLHEYYDEKADALQRWADLIGKAVACLRAGDVDAVRLLDPTRRKRRRHRERLNPHSEVDPNR